jgi:hypothetical protein
LGEERRAICGTGAAGDQLDEPAAQARSHRHPCGFACLRFAADLDDYALTFVQSLAAWDNLALR